MNYFCKKLHHGCFTGLSICKATFGIRFLFLSFFFSNDPHNLLMTTVIFLQKQISFQTFYPVFWIFNNHYYKNNSHNWTFIKVEFIGSIITVHNHGRSRLVSTQQTFTCSKSTIKTLDCRCSGVFIVNFKHISHVF